MHALVRVHKLCDVQIRGDAGEHVGVIARHMLIVDEKFNHLTHRLLRSFIQIQIHSHGDVFGRRFRAWPGEMQILAHNKLKSADEGSFHRGDVHLAVALPGVAIANFK